MCYFINDTQTIWLEFNQTYQIYTKVQANWNENTVICDPNGLVNINWTGTGKVDQTLIGEIKTPSKFGQLKSYPLNVTFTNDRGTNKAEWFPSMVAITGLPTIVWSYDQLNNNGNVNMIVIFEKL